MLRSLAANSVRTARIMGRSNFPSVNAIPTIRKFSSEDLTIPVDKDQQGGRRKQELDAESVGQVGFNRDPIIPPDDAGTKENPILVPSSEHSRVVGYEDPFTHQLVWFNLDKGPLHYVPDIGLYFKLASNH